MFSFFRKKQENCETISGHFQYVNHKYTTSRRKHIWHLENIRNTITRDENSQREYFEREKKSKPTQKYSFITFTKKCS